MYNDSILESRRREVMVTRQSVVNLLSAEKRRATRLANQQRRLAQQLLASKSYEKSCKKAK